MFDFSDNKRTGISKLISLCAIIDNLYFRSVQGIWTLIPRIYSPKKVIDRLATKICIHAPTSSAIKVADSIGNPDPVIANNDSIDIVSYEGKFNRHTDTEEQARESGRVLTIHDDQIKGMIQGRNIFEYSITVDIRDPE